MVYLKISKCSCLAVLESTDMLKKNVPPMSSCLHIKTLAKCLRSYLTAHSCDLLPSLASLKDGCVFFTSLLADLLIKTLWFSSLKQNSKVCSFIKFSIVLLLTFGRVQVVFGIGWNDLHIYIYSNGLNPNLLIGVTFRNFLLPPLLHIKASW